MTIVRTGLLTVNAAPVDRPFRSEIAHEETSLSPILHLPRRFFRSRKGVPYHLYVPSRIDRQARPLVSVHGISRRADEHLKAFAPWAERTGRLLIAPLFAESHCRRYQKVVMDRRRADKALFDVLLDIEETKGIAVGRFDLFGFSGGAQFGHRLALLYPERVGRLALASAGWYTFPDRSATFPYGVSPGRHRSDEVQPKLSSFLRIPALVLVGERDVLRDPGLRKEPALDLHQGRSRVERAARWTMAMRSAAVDLGLQSDISFQTVPGCGHSFERCVRDGGMATTVTSWLERA